MTNIATIRNGIFSTLVACGPYDAAQVSTCDYGIVERNSGCAIVFHFSESNYEPITYGGAGNIATKFGIIQFTGECYIQYTGDSAKFLADVYTAVDDVRSTIGKDDTLQNSACFAYVSRFGYNIDEGYEMGGKDWGVVRFDLVVHDL